MLLEDSYELPNSPGLERLAWSSNALTILKTLLTSKSIIITTIRR